MTAGFLKHVAGLRVAPLSFVLLCLAALPMQAQRPGCARFEFDGEVAVGKSFRHSIDASHVFLLENIASGWIIRVLPVGGVRPPHDYAELATPPYRSPNPLLISTDFSFRSQDAIAWNPREFHYFTTPQQMTVAASALEASEREPNRPAAGAALFPLLPQACAAELRITDARIVGGTADQAAMAATVASHFAQTAHTLETSAAPSSLGRIVLLRFRVQFRDSAFRAFH